MILCLCPSPAIDVTYRVSRLEQGATNRVEVIARRPGGKAVNVARVLQQCGEDSRVLAPVGGASGQEFAAGAEASGLAAQLVPSGLPTRTTVTVVDDAGTATLLAEPSVIDCWPELLAEAERTIPLADVVVVSGVWPEGSADDAVAQLVGAARAAGRPMIVDTSGPALLAAIEAGATMVKPNADELLQVTGDSDPLRAARNLARARATTVVVSLGEHGVIAASGGDTWIARPGCRLVGNPTGAGDALVAGLARGLRVGAGVPTMLCDAVALSAAAVLHPFAGEVRTEDWQQQRAAVVVTALEELR